MKKIFILFMALSFSTISFSQTNFCPNDPPLNPFLADSPYPIFHRNNYAQASTCIAGPTAEDSIIIKVKSGITGSTSPWVYLSDRYPNGERVLLQSNATHVYKFIDNGEQIVTIDSLRIDFDFLRSFGWEFILAKDKIWYTYDPKYDPAENEFTRLFKLTDADTTDPYSDIIVLDTFNFGDYGINKVLHFSLNYEGNLVFHSDEDTLNQVATVGVINPEFNLLDTFVYSISPGEIVRHNAFTIDENNSFYIVTTRRLIRFDWDGNELSFAWEALYDFVNDGPDGQFAEGSGTTPTLMGWGDDNDQLVIVADGHANNNLLAFWRELPDGWTGIPGMDIRFADSISIPYANAINNTFQSIENSPTVNGYEVAIAQFNGFLQYNCNNAKGVQKFVWDTDNNRFDLQWATDAINMNGVLCYSSGSNLLYGSGKEADCNYYYYGLNWETGTLDFRLLLGPEETFLSDPFRDGGSNNIIDEEGNIYFPGAASLVKLERKTLVSTKETPRLTAENIRIYPNPAHDFLHIESPYSFDQIEIYDLTGSIQGVWENGTPAIDIRAIPPGLYIIQFLQGNTSILKKWIKAERE